MPGVAPPDPPNDLEVTLSEVTIDEQTRAEMAEIADRARNHGARDMLTQLGEGDLAQEESTDKVAGGLEVVAQEDSARMAPPPLPPPIAVPVIPNPAGGGPNPPPDWVAKKQWEMWGKQADAVITVNETLIADSKGIARLDPKASTARFWFMIGLSAATILGTIGLIVAAATKDLATAVACGAVALGLVVTAGLVNPLQTVERDILFRRWSDMITHTFLNEAASFTLQAADLKEPADEANRRFGSMAKAYAICTAQTFDAMTAIAGTADESSKESETATATETPKTPSIEKIDTQKGTKGADVHLDMKASGAEPLTFTVAGLPLGLKLCEYCGDISGTIDPNANDSYTSKVEVIDKEKATATVSFKWELSAP